MIRRAHRHTITTLGLIILNTLGIIFARTYKPTHRIGTHEPPPANPEAKPTHA
jgi:hypothetical protein